MEMWRELLRPLDSELARVVSLDKVRVSRDGSRMAVSLKAERPLTQEEIDALREALANGFPGVRLETSVRYTALRGQFQNDPCAFSSVLANELNRVHPGALPYITWNDRPFGIEDGMLVVYTAGEAGAAYIHSRNVENVLKEIIADLFGLDVPVRAATRGSEEQIVSAIAQKRDEEMEIIRKLSEAASAPEKTESKKKQADTGGVLLGRSITDPTIDMSELTDDTGRAVVCGEVIASEIKEAKNGKTRIAIFSLTDYTNSIPVKAFLTTKRTEDTKGDMDERTQALTDGLQPGNWVKIRGEWSFDTFSKEMSMIANDICTAEKPPMRMDDCEEKRVELHMHTMMSNMDAVATAADLIKRVAKWGHKAVAITDHGVVQAFPEAFGAAKKAEIKLIPGCEGYLIDDAARIVADPDDRLLSESTFVVLDVETTGLDTAHDEIIELGAVRFENGKAVGEFNELVNPGIPIPEAASKVNKITDTMVRDKPTIDEIIPRFAKFCEGAVLCAHNAPFDMAFMKRAFTASGLPFDYPQLDTLPLFRNTYTQLKSFKLGAICKHLKVNLVDAHRACNDARATGECMLICLNDPACSEAKRLHELNTVFSSNVGGSTYHIILLAKNQGGMTNLNKLVSESHVNYFHNGPRMPRSVIEKYREGLIIGSACEAGELFRAMVAGASEKKLEEIASFYDYLEIQPIGNNAFMLRKGMVESEEELRNYNRRILALGKKLGKPVVATGDVHFMEPRDSILRAIAMTAKGFEDADYQPPLYLHTTQEMLDEFAYLGKKDAHYVVIETPNAIADQVEKISLFPIHPEGKETFQPFWPDAENDIRTRVANKARRIYGDPLPEIVQKRLDKELGSIIGYGFSTLYDIAVKLVEESNRNGYLVGSRGSVGSSLVAFMADITEVNALPAHYICPSCKHVEFDVPPQYSCGLDLPAKDCPVCGRRMNKDGYNIPFEVFLGFKGDKVPDIDLNFSGEYQQTGQHYIETLFGKGKVFRAGTIGRLKDKTAYGYVLKYFEKHQQTVSNAEKDRLAKGLEGVKRTTGQHPGGMVLCPEGYDIYDFTAIQHPADDQNSEFITTHYDFNSMHDVLVKVDMLGHDDPTMLKDLQDLTGIPPREVPLNDPEVFRQVLQLFDGPECMGVTAEQTGLPTGTLGIPEFGTNFTIQMLVDTKPTTMEELVRISGLSHGTDVWTNNAQDLVRAGTVPLNKCLCTRDDIMNQLMQYGVPSKVSFDTMEFVRKGKAAKGDGLKPEMLAAMQEHDVPQWFIDSCNKIQYMFPKAHAVAYVTYALRIAYFKLFYPAAYYTCWLKRNADAFSATEMVVSQDALRGKIKEIQEMDRDERKNKEDKLDMLMMLLEMSLRGVVLRPVDMYKSDPGRFLLLDDNSILPPLSRLDGLGLAAAQGYATVREAGPFISKEDMLSRKVQPSIITAFEEAGILGDMPETSQISLFSF